MLEPLPPTRVGFFETVLGVTVLMGLICLELGHRGARVNPLFCLLGFIGSVALLFDDREVSRKGREPAPRLFVRPILGAVALTFLVAMIYSIGTPP